MATSQIVLYKTNITPERNCKVDDIGSYLITCEQEIISDFQYKVIRLDDTIKLNMSQTNTPNFPYNYLAVKRDSETKIYYYFILNSNWKSENTVELQISLDTINTFWNELSWTAKTNITRQHKDRFLQKARDASGTTRFQRIIDDYDEGITPVKFLKSEKKMNDNNKPDINWYLIYKSNPSADTTLDCLLCVDGDYEIPVLMNGLNPAALSLNSTYYIDGADGDVVYTTRNGIATTIGLNKDLKALYINKDSTGTVKVIGVAADEKNNKELDSFDDYFNVGTRRLHNNSANLRTIPRQNTTPEFLSYDNLINDYEVLDINYIGQNKVRQFKDVDRTDTKLVKIIKMPYAPFETLDEFQWRVVFDFTRLPFLRLAELDTEFLTQINQDTFSELQRTLTNDYIDSLPVHDITMESKLFNSNFYGVRYYYDNFEKEFLLERYSPKSTNTQNIYATIKFKQSNNISSNSLFDFELTNANYNEPTVYSRYMMANRSQELAIYTNDYLNYIRNGYNYDKKIKSAQNTANKIGLAASVVGATASFVSSIWTGGAGVAAGISFATSAIASLTSTIVTIQNNELTLSQKLEDENRKASSVSTMDDTNLLAYYNGNRLISIREQCTEQMRQAIYNLFRLTGYGCNEYGIPNFNSRIYYNFVQCKAAFDESNWKYGQDFLNDIRSRFEIGVTVYHRLNDSYDWLQEKENFESWMMQ